MASTNVGSIHYDLKLDTEQFDRATQNISTKLAGVGKKMASFGKKTTMLVTLPILGAAGAAFKAAADYEQLQIAFETMLGSAEKAKKLLNELDDLAVKTPFSISEVQEAAKRLLAYGIEADKVIETTKVLGDIAAGVGTDKFPQLILAFGQVRAANKLTGMELRQFTEAGVPLLEELGKHFNKSIGEIQTMVSEGEVGFADVEQALKNLTGAGGRFNDLMQKQSETTAGKISNLKDELIRLGRIIGAQLLPHVQDVVGYLKELVEKFKSLPESVQGSIIKFGLLAAVVGPLVLFFGHMIQAIGILAGLFANPIFLLIAGILAVIAGTAYLIHKNWESIKPVVDSVVGAFKVAYGWFKDNLLPILQVIWGFVKNNFIAAWNDTKESVKRVIDILAPYKTQLMVLGGVIAALVFGPIALFIGITATLIGAFLTVISVIVRVGAWFSNLASAVFGAVLQIGKIIASGIQHAINSIWGFYGSFVDAGWGLITAFANGIRGAFGKAVGAVKDGLSAVRRLLPFSDAKEGPLSDLTLSGRRFSETFAKGILQGGSAIYGAATSALTYGNPSVAMAGASAAGNVSTSIYGNINIGSNADGESFMKRLTRNQELAFRQITTRPGSLG